MSPGSAAAKAPRSARADSGDLQGLPDHDLLARFFHSHDEAAFAVLVARYGPLVLGVCQRVLGNANDAEDAFQATFLILVKKGGALRQPGRLASWLYGVAYRTARKVKSKAVLRSNRESQASTMFPTMPNTSELGDMTYQELRSILDEEISQLPEKYSLPLVLCYLEGKTNAQAAAELGWPEGSMSRRLSRARNLLRSRLAKRGLALSVALIAAVFSQPAVACVPPHLMASTLEAAHLVASGAAVNQVVSPAVNEVVDEAVDEAVIEVVGDATTDTGKLALTAALLAVVLAVLGWQVGNSAFAANLFRSHAGPHSLTTSPGGGATATVDGGGSATVNGGGCLSTQTGCGTASGCGSAAP